MLTMDEKATILRALRAWAENAPDEPMIGFLGSKSLLTPHELIANIETQTSDGKAILQILEHGVRREGIEEVIARLAPESMTSMRSSHTSGGAESMLTMDEQATILDALKVWAEKAPDEPVVGFLRGKRPLKPREIVAHVEHHTSDGEAVLEILEHGVRREGIKAVIARLERPVRARSF